MNHLSRKKSFVIFYVGALFLYAPLILLRLTNDMDGMWDQDDHAAGVAELRIGRWFWPYLDRLRMNVSLDPLPAVVSLAIFVCGILLLFSALRLRMTKLICAAGFLMLLSPAVLCQLSYSYMSITFSVSFFLAVLAVWLIVGEERFVLPGQRASESKESGPAGNRAAVRSAGRTCGRIALSALAVSLMMGCYQASLGITCLAALFVFLFLLSRDCSIRKAFRFAGQMFAALVLGAVLYEIFLNVHLAVLHETLSDYNGADAITFSGIVRNLPSGIRHTYSAFSFYFLQQGYRFNALEQYGWFRLLYLIPAMAVVGFIWKTVRNFHGRERGIVLVLLMLSAAFIPIFASPYFLLAGSSELLMQMTAGLGLILPLTLSLFTEWLPEAGANAAECEREPEAESANFHEKVQSDNSEKRELRDGHGRKATRFLIAAGIFLFCYGAAAQTAIDQYAMYMGRRASMTLAERALDRFAASGIDYTENVVMVYGSPKESPLFTATDLYSRANSYAQYGSFAPGAEGNRLCWSHFFEQQLRVNVNYAEGDTLETIYNSPEVAAMPVYPAPGSTANVWGVTVVKISP